MSITSSLLFSIRNNRTPVSEELFPSLPPSIAGFALLESATPVIFNVPETEIGVVIEQFARKLLCCIGGEFEEIGKAARQVYEDTKKTVEQASKKIVEETEKAATVVRAGANEVVKAIPKKTKKKIVKSVESGVNTETGEVNFFDMALGFIR